MIKSEIRKMMQEQRNALSKSVMQQKNKQILDSILKDERFISSSTVAIYYPLGNEVDLLALLKEPKRFAFPKVEKDGIHFYLFHPELKFVKSQFGVMEPVSVEEIDDQIDFMLVPALAISKDSYRIGFGKGYYDQFLNKVRPRWVFGVIYDFQKVDSIPIETHDQQLDGFYKG